MKKTFLSFVIASAFVFGFTACGGAEGEGETTETPADTTAEAPAEEPEVMEADTTAEVMEADTTAEVMEADTTMEEEM